MEDRLDNAARDKFIEELDDKLKSWFGGDRYKDSLKEQFALAKRFYEYLLKPDGSPDSQLFDDIAFSMDADVMNWIIELPFALGCHGGMVDEAVEIASLFANVHSPDNFFGDMAVILAEEGRREEAIDRISKNLEIFPDDAWAIIKAGDAFRILKETDKALELYNRAYGMTSLLSYDRDGVLERLVPLLRELGRETEADALVEIEEKAEKARAKRYERREREETNYTPIIETPKQTPPRPRKVGRNETCPCGSGKKYKKCCGG
jgi:tetratricopeptide (TPR) repeat protein